MKKIGVWLIGALGSISVTVILGSLLLKKDMSHSTGMVTETEPFKGLKLVPVEAMQFGGCDIRNGKLCETTNQIVQKNAGLDPAVIEAVRAELAQIERNIYPGTSFNCGEAIGELSAVSGERGKSLREEIEEVVGLINGFKLSNGLDEVVVVNLASTEPLLELKDYHYDITALNHCIDKNLKNSLRASAIYTYAAITSGCPYINFTPSNGALFPALVQLAEHNSVPVMGNDGKTGETLVKSALAPMFKDRNLQILSWEGFNILGNMDGQILDCDENRQSKIKSKDAVLGKILGYTPHSQVHIDFVPSLGDRKTAWDFIHFQGFLGTKMSLQFVWEGYDSALAAPLVLDLVRFAEFAHRRGEAGLMPHLASYFKDPIGVDEHGLHQQFDMLIDYVEKTQKASKA
ncbi:MAG: inositol-3-phosphate synthase [Deltaproteobacteria bacterium]|nr:inositol-3-phosphate synthase [Deltaproteobacteria bacterium]